VVIKLLECRQPMPSDMVAFEVGVGVVMLIYGDGMELLGRNIK
jgi:hypothetical protein